MKTVLYLVTLILLSNVSCKKLKLKQSIFPPGENQEAGLIKLQNDDMFYWLFRSKSKPSNDPLIIWLSGGPGCAFDFAAMRQTGGYWVNDDLTISINKYSWSNFSNIVFLDQPVGVGYSKASSPNSYAKNSTMYAEGIYNFLIGFFQRYPEFKGRDLYFNGESYGAKFAAAIGDYILKHPHNDIKLKGVSLAAGLIDVQTQFSTHAEYVKRNNLLNEEDTNALKEKMQQCTNMIQNNEITEDTSFFCQGALFSPFNTYPYKFNFYNIKKPCIGYACVDFGKTFEISTNPDVKALWGVSDRPLERACSHEVSSNLTVDFIVSAKEQVANLLDNKVKVLVYSGTADYVCNYLSQDAWVNAMKWEGAENFAKEKYAKVDSVGEYKKYKNLTLLRMYDLGHLAPNDDPETVYNLYIQFMKGVHDI